MHHRSFVVSIIDRATQRAYREFDHSRDGDDSKARVTLPFDSEYAFLFKVTDGKRRRVQITIDGTAIGVGSVVVPGWGQAVLERFLDSDKRFKFVPATSDGVADPTSKENGVVIVNCWVERQPPDYLSSVLRSASASPGGQHTNSSRRSLYGDVGGSSASYASGQSIGSSHDGATVSNWDASPETVSPQAGATVEGTKSDQHLATTEWRGDEYALPQTFRFQLVGVSAEAKVGFCTECGFKLRKADKFCASCGTKVLAPV